ncbi:hypothetical protein UMZ34_17445 [Halopseudomonas pachastrellae]|nr:hypothetical protein UMZ34_17445 [Halopseudomonas pachastrellae]
MSPSGSSRKRRVIDAEFQTRLADDDIHAQAVLATQVHPEHPLSRFTAGNAQTLAGDAAALSERLSQWHAIHYRAGSMALVLHGPQAPEQLLALAQASAEQLLAVARLNRSPSRCLRQSSCRVRLTGKVAAVSRRRYCSTLCASALCTAPRRTGWESG